MRSLLAAVLAGPAIGFVSEFASVHRATRYEPPISEAESVQMENMTVSEMKAVMAKRRIVMSRWEWLRDSAPYFYFWKDLAYRAVIPSSGVFLACMWVGWMEERHVQKLKTGI
ncbi:MAG TPA: hypothetical protein VF493_14605 [Terriglobales bacterium]